MDQQFINDVLKILPSDIGLIQIKQYTLSSTKQEMEVFSTIESSAKISVQSLNQIKELKTKLKTLQMPQKSYDRFIESLFPVYGRGEKIYGLPNLHSYVDGLFLENQKLETLIDIINIIIFWSSDNWDSLQLLKDLETRLNIQSLDIQIIAINIDQSYESWEKCMIDLQTYNSFYLDKSNNMYEILLKTFQINLLPHVIILNHDQIIHVTGVYTFHQIEGIVKDLNNKDNNKQEFQQNQDAQLALKTQVSKEEFKIMKNLLKQDISDMMSALISEENYIELKLFKKVKLNVSGKKEAIYRSQLLIEHQIQKDSIEQFDGFIQFLDEIIPEKKYIHVKESQFQAITDEEQIFIDFTNNILTQFQIELIKYKQEEFNYQWKYQNNTFFCEHIISEQVKFNKAVDLKLYHQIKASIDEQGLDEKLQKKFNALLIKLLEPIGLGQRFQNIDGFLNSQGKEIIIEHNQGQMLVLLFLMPCPFIIIKLEQAFQKLKEMYGQKIRLVYLAIDKNDDDIQAIYKYSPEAQFFYPSIDPQILRVKYNASVFPFFIIVDQFGIIRHADLFLSFFDKIDYVYQKQIATQQQNQEIDLQGLQNFLLHQEYITKELGDEFQFEFKIQIKQNEKQEFVAITEFMYRQIESQVINNMLAQLEQYIPKEKNTLVQNLIKSVNIPYPGSRCGQCFAQLGKDQPQYYNFFQNVFYCIKCAESAKKSIKDLLVFINTPITNLNALKDIDQYRFGKNIQPIGEPGLLNLTHDYSCNGCLHKNIMGNRYIVLNKQKGKLRQGGFTDYCQNCFELIKSKFPQAKKFECVDENTIFLRVLYNFGYYNF